MAKFWNRVTPTQLHAASLYHWWIPRCKVWWLSKSSVLSHQITPFLFRRKDLPRRHWQIHLLQFFNRCEPISGRTLQRCLVFLDGEPPLLSTSSGNLSLMASRLFCFLGSLTRSTINIPSLIRLRPHEWWAFDEGNFMFSGWKERGWDSRREGGKSCHGGGEWKREREWREGSEMKEWCRYKRGLNRESSEEKTSMWDCLSERDERVMERISEEES